MSANQSGSSGYRRRVRASVSQDTADAGAVLRVTWSADACFYKYRVNIFKKDGDTKTNLKDLYGSKDE